MASGKEFRDNADILLGKIQEAVRTGQESIALMNHWDEIKERLESSQNIRDKEMAHKIRVDSIKYWNRALCIWRILFIITLIIIIFF